MNRHDLYARPHKALRAMMADTLVALGRMDASDECEVRDTLARLEELLAFCERHAVLEDEFIHRALDARCKDGACPFAVDHFGHAREIEALRAAAHSRAPDLYRRVAAFIGANLLHMEREEREANALLWEHFSDAELAAIEVRLRASITPGEAMQGLRWMLPASSHAERVALFGSLRNAPPTLYESALAIARTHLREGDLRKLDAALAQREPATLAS